MTPQPCQRIALPPTAAEAPRPVDPGSAAAGRKREDPVSVWPLMTHLELAAMRTAVPCFRKHARLVALEWGLPELAERIELIVSELVTNSVLAAEHSRADGLATPVVRLWLFTDLRCVLVRVWDGSREMPVRRDAGPDEERGRGLMLVEHLSSDWGTYREAHGKVIWVLI
jgi:anti-sigma regulatory factor (Ser/Thr protein kinase)